MEKVCGGNEVLEQLKKKKERKKGGRGNKRAPKAKPTPMAQFRKRSM